jgi:hypothetical protein
MCSSSPPVVAGTNDSKLKLSASGMSDVKNLKAGWARRVVLEHVNNSLTNFPSFPATAKFVLRDHPFTLYDNSKTIAPFTKPGSSPACRIIRRCPFATGAFRHLFLSSSQD